MRIPQPKADKGSQWWLQELINNKPSILDKYIYSSIPQDIVKIEWLSPLAIDNYSEYRDTSFLERLGLTKLNTMLKHFWPQRGPQWDALGREVDTGTYFLVEAKANVPELFSDCRAKNPSSIELIDKSLSTTREWLNCECNLDWKKGFYQYANRLAHLYFLRKIGKINAYLIFLYFVNDNTHIHTELNAWKAALYVQKRVMGLSHDYSKNGVVEIFLDINEIIGYL